jgi:AraC family transcriptional regulator
MADRTLRHEAPAGSLAICPVGIDCAADTDESVDATIVAVQPGQLALAAAEGSTPEAQLIERLCGYDTICQHDSASLRREPIRST